MTTREQAEIIRAAILATFEQAFPGLDGETLAAAARSAANNAAFAMTPDDDE